MMELLNALQKYQAEGTGDVTVLKEGLETLVLLLSPIVPHLSHALWHGLGHTEAIIDIPWPAVDATALIQDTLTMVVQVNGKVRANISVPTQHDRNLLEKMALAEENIQRHIGDQTIEKIIVVPNRLINIVVKQTL